MGGFKRWRRPRSRGRRLLPASVRPSAARGAEAVRRRARRGCRPAPRPWPCPGPSAPAAAPQPRSPAPAVASSMGNLLGGVSFREPTTVEDCDSTWQTDSEPEPEPEEPGPGGGGEGPGQEPEQPAQPPERAGGRPRASPAPDENAEAAGAEQVRGPAVASGWAGAPLPPAMGGRTPPGKEQELSWPRAEGRGAGRLLFLGGRTPRCPRPSWYPRAGACGGRNAAAAGCRPRA